MENKPVIKPGRPRKYKDNAQRQRAFREKQRHKSERFDIYLSEAAAWRVQELVVAWNSTSAKVIERLILEATEQYREILLPETKKSGTHRKK